MQGALIEPLAVAWHTANRCRLEVGQTVATHAALQGTRVDGTAVVVAIHHVPLVIPPFDLLMPEVYVTGVAMSAHAFPRVIEAMAQGGYPLEDWVEIIPFDALVERGLERLRRQERIG